MASQSDRERWLREEPPFDDIACGLQAGARLPRAMLAETRETIALARRFNREVVRPLALDLDRRVQETPDYLPWEFVRTANRWGLFSLWIPRIFGGKGRNLPSFSYFIEELASACTALANLVGVHYLGVATLIATWNTRIARHVFRQVVQGEESGNPCMISLALTEPDAGTDVEETALMDMGHVTCLAERVRGGYVVNGRKVFISNGHLSRWHMLCCFADSDRPSEHLVVLAVERGTKGFSLGRIERKMGQKACPASELIFDDCFVPDRWVCLDPAQAGRLARTPTETTMQFIDYVFSASRAGVGAFGTGVARGAYETALDFAARTEVEGRPLINHEWAQAMLAQMYRNVAVSRLAYVESNHANGLYGMFRLLQKQPLFSIMKHAPGALIDGLAPLLLDSPTGTRLLRRLHCDRQTRKEIERTSGWGSLAKFSGTDAGVKNAQMALALMGEAGLRHDRGAEKHLRDAKLMQIYEGTNQLNRLNLFKCLIARCVPGATVFEE